MTTHEAKHAWELTQAIYTTLPAEQREAVKTILYAMGWRETLSLLENQNNDGYENKDRDG